MAHVTVEVDVDFDELDAGDLIDAFLERLEKFKSKSLRKYEMNVFTEKIKQIQDALTNSAGFEVKTLDDQFKVDHLHKVFDKYTSAEVENALP